VPARDHAAAGEISAPPGPVVAAPNSRDGARCLGSDKLAGAARLRHHSAMQRGVSGHGPDLAKPPAVLDRVDLDRWHRHLATAVDRKWARSRSLAFFAIYAAWAGFCFALWRHGYPPWRVVALAVLLVVLVATHLRSLALCDPRALPEGEARHPFAVSLLASALTGGLHSPMLIGVLGNFSGVLLRHGWNRQTRAILASLIGGTALMALVPDAWLGPPIPEPTWSITLVVVLVISVALHTDYMVIAMKTAGAAIRQLLKARAETASQALARAEELERMSSHLSHELKNPLGAIKALVQLSARAEQDPEIRLRLEVVEDEVERMQAILQGYLSFSRPLEALHPEPVEVGAIADDVTAVLEARADDARVAVRRTGDARITADPRRLKEALLNLVANAIEATPPGGSVQIRIVERGDRVELSVEDTGRGMPPEVLARIGTPFFTTREKGTGLGVLLARGVFQQHGGTLEYASTPGRGTVATATLPYRPRPDVAKDSDGARALGG
jgi:signal transduction histidine kinase